MTNVHYKNKQYVLYNNVLGPIMRTESKRVKRRYLEQFNTPPDASFEQFLTVHLDEHSPEFIRSILETPEPEFIGPYVLTTDQWIEVSDRVIQISENMASAIERFLPLLHTVKFTSNEFERIMGLLDMCRPIVEIARGKYDDVETEERPWEEDVLDRVVIAADYLDFKPRGALSNGEDVFNP